MKRKKIKAVGWALIFGNAHESFLIGGKVSPIKIYFTKEKLILYETIDKSVIKGKNKYFKIRKVRIEEI